MFDFMSIATRSTKRGTIEIYPKFLFKKSSDLLIRGGDFYAIWGEDRGLWSTDEDDAIQLIDRELQKYTEEHRQQFQDNVKTLYLWDAESGMIDSWHKYCQKQMRDNFHMLDEKLIFSNSETNKKDYASKRLPYPLEVGPTPAWDKLIGTLYSKEERHKIEWAIGSIVSGILVFAIGTQMGRTTSTTRLVLSGMAISTIFSALTNLLIYFAKNSNQAKNALFWTIGSLGGAKWDVLFIPFTALVIVIIASFIMSKSLDILLLGDDSAVILGINVKLVKSIILILETLLT